MVLHNSKWDRKAKKKYLKKHNLKPEDVARDKTGSNTAPGVGFNNTPIYIRGNANLSDDSGSSDSDSDSENTPNDKGLESGLSNLSLSEETKNITDDDPKADLKDEKNKYSRRKPLSSNSWRYAEPEVDPYLKSESEPEPDYAHMKAREFQVPDSFLKKPKHAIAMKQVSRFNDYASDLEESDDSLDDERHASNQSVRNYAKKAELNEEDLEYQRRTGRLKNNIQVMDSNEEFQKLQAKIARAKAANEIKEKFGKSVYDRGAAPTRQTIRLDDTDEADIDSFLNEIEQANPGNASFSDEDDLFFASLAKNDNTEGASSVKTKVADSEAWLDGLLG